MEQQVVDEIVTQLEKLEYGSLLITVHNGKVTQVDCTEKRRLNKN
ncbi:YezD family protein [Shouchella hunanensis]|uniref:YezD family protein n=2 Tax=Shouchella TaxID=2893057 RepID=A0ABY7WCJ6_9BACI|nr:MULTISPECIES: YezD family protein [Shouchella]MED4128815.1 YezD family protein [Shouchella miscanthi]WDF05836.1 YezD family protein [Shouchella hunanensis]